MDESVITLATHYASKTVIDRQFAYSFPPAVSPVMCAEEVIRLWEAYGMDADRGDDIVVDSLGVGAGTTGILIRRGLPVIRYAGGSSASNPERFRNLRVQTYIALRDAFRDGTIAWAEDMAEPQFLNELESQLCSVKLNPNSNRVDDLMSKQDMLRAGLKSPDRADSLAMQFVTAATPYAKGDTGESIIVVPSEAWSRY